MASHKEDSISRLPRTDNRRREELPTASSSLSMADNSSNTRRRRLIRMVSRLVVSMVNSRSTARRRREVIGTRKAGFDVRLRTTPNMNKIRRFQLIKIPRT